MERVAECHCGALKVTVSGEPERVYVCHCKSCQRRTGAVVHSGARYWQDKVRIAGEHRIYARPADSGFIVRWHFCPNCGSNVFWEGDKVPGLYGITVGSLADPEFPAPTFSIYEEAMHPWLEVKSATAHHPRGLPPTPA